MFTKNRNKSVKPTSKSIKSGFWFSAAARKTLSADESLEDISTTISTINLEEISNSSDSSLDHHQEKSGSQKDETKDLEFDAGNDQLSVAFDAENQEILNQVSVAKRAENLEKKAWNSPLKSLKELPTVLPDEDSTEFQIHLADASVLNQQQQAASPLHRTVQELLPGDDSSPLTNTPKVAAKIPRSPLLKSVNIPDESLPAENALLVTNLQEKSINQPNGPSYSTQSTLNQSNQDWKEEYEARLEFAKEQSKNFILNLQDQLDYAESRVLLLERQNEELQGFCADATTRDHQSNQNILQMADEIDQLRSALHERQDTENEIAIENQNLRKMVEELTGDLKAVSSRLDRTRKQSMQQETDFEMFSRKIKSQQLLISELQEEKDQLVSALRKAQYDPPTEPAEAQLQMKLDQALYDVESLKLLVNDLKQENERLSVIATSPSRQDTKTFRTQANLDNDELWAIPTESERLALLRKLQQFEREVEQDAQPVRVPSPAPSLSASSTVSSRFKQLGGSAVGEALSPLKQFSKPVRVPTNDLRQYVSQTFQKQNQSDLEFFKDEYYRRKEQLDNQLRLLSDEKKKLSFELSRVPSVGAKALSRQSELESMLDSVDSQMAAIRREMKEFGIF